GARFKCAKRTQFGRITRRCWQHRELRREVAPEGEAMCQDVPCQVAHVRNVRNEPNSRGNRFNPMMRRGLSLTRRAGMGSQVKNPRDFARATPRGVAQWVPGDLL